MAKGPITEEKNQNLWRQGENVKNCKLYSFAILNNQRQGEYNVRLW